MRRKSERTATKKAKASPEKKLEKVKRTRTRRGRKHSTSSENESEHEKTPVREVEEVVQTEKKPPSTPVKEDSPEETPDQVWQVKTAESSGDVGEIKKLKICLTRPPSTPERPERSPRSKRKHSRATSSSDTPSVEGAEEKKKSKHKSKRSMRESKEESDKNDSQGDETEIETQKPADEVSQSTDTEKPAVTDDTPMSTTNEEKTEENEKPEQNKSDVSDSNTANTDTDLQNKSSDADTTVVSPKHDDQDKTSEEVTDRKTNPEANEEKMEVLEIHADESRFESMESSRIDDDNSEERVVVKPGVEPSSPEGKVSITEENSASETTEAQQSANKHDVVESSENIDTRTFKDTDNNAGETKERYSNRELERSDSTQSVPEENHNGPSVPFVVNRKRRWGSRPSRVSSQKSITISTDVLKEIIPDVKPVEFEEVIEEKKHKRIEIPDRDKVDRPVLPKIVIDNTDGGDQNRKEENSVEENTKARESLGSNRKISIVIENDSIIARPPSPPRHKQSNILYITNLVRPFTLPQLKNLLQRTGRIVENGFWIDRIKSKCFVQYETEDQAIETRHALHGVTWPVSNPKTLQVDFSSSEAFDKAKQNEENDTTPVSTIPGTVEDWLREQDMKRERGEVEKPWERKAAMREWDMGKNEKDKEKDKLHRDDRSMERRRNRTSDRSPEPAKKFKKKEEEAPAKLLDDLFRKTKTTPCIYWLPLSAETIAVKEEQRRQHMAEHERRLQELRRTQHRRH